MSKVSKFLLSTAAIATVASGLTAAGVSAANAADSGVVRVSTLKSSFTDSAGKVWNADSGFAGGWQNPNTTGVDIAGTTNDKLFQSEHYGMTGWSAPVANGTYKVTLKTAETYWSQRGARVFSVTAEGQNVISNLDIFAEVGKNVALNKSFTVKVDDGTLNLGFSQTRNYATVSAILVENSGAVSGTPRPSNPTPTLPPVTLPPVTLPPVTTPPVTTPPVTTPPVTTPPTTPPVAPGPTRNASGHEWMSGSSGVGAADGQFGNWRGSNLDIVSSWAGNADNSANFYTLWKGAEYGNWNGSMDMAVGGIDSGETWSQAASGRYDARWAASLTKLKSLWAGRQGTMYIRFAHEMNGYWFSWSVNKNNYQDFMTSWKRYRALQQQIFPEAKLVFSVNKESNGPGMNWTNFFPGKQYVDVLSVDYYNNWPYAATVDQFNAQSWDKDGYGAPKGINAHLAFAKSQGLPLSVSEWSGNADDGDSPGFVQGMYDFFKANAGTGAGQLAYEVQFNCDIDNHRWLLNGGSRMPNSAAKYKELF
ncbi:malectin domain-containing carbohydrate-binding protein [Kineococcus sp. NBC_00420]|uniref:malectin domain-containing carbohydrate-binding protein n=1 Tax=Kineococcus sp. NBC_00420 TaxID=2903564 RepID=UPI002E24FF10